MSEILDKAIAALTEKLGSADIGSVVKFAIDGVGEVIVDGTQSPPAISAGDGAADVTIGAAPDVFQDMLAGQIDPTGAYMSGKLRIDGDMGVAMKLAPMLG